MEEDPDDGSAFSDDPDRESFDEYSHIRTFMKRLLIALIIGTATAMIAIWVIVPLLLTPFSRIISGDDDLFRYWALAVERYFGLLAAFFAAMFSIFYLGRYYALLHKTHRKDSLTAHVEDPTLWAIMEPIVWVVAGLHLIPSTLSCGIDAYKVLIGGKQGIARVIDTYDDVVEYDDGRRSAIVTMAVYEFQANGNSWRGETKGPRGAWSKGDEVIIKYSPDNPRRNEELGHRESLGNFIMFGMFTIVGAVLYLQLKQPALYERWHNRLKYRR